MSKRKVACFIVFGAAAVTLAGYSAYAQRTIRAQLAEQASSDFFKPQSANRSIKTDRLVVQTALQTIEDKPVFALASAMPDMVIEPRANPVIAAAPKIPEPKQAVESKPVVAALPQHEKAEKPKHLLPPPPPAPAKEAAVLDDGQISGLKGRLRLSSDQVEYWPAVEAALRDVVRTQLRGARAIAGKINIDTNSPEVQKLIWAAMPLLMRLREDQKSEVRKLARVIGLDQVASQI